MPSALPDGEPAPVDGALPDSALAGLGERPFGVYVHVPFCTTRCGYCDFNTYTDLGGMRSSYVDSLVQELRLAKRVLGAPPPVDTVFLGGGTPTLLPPDDLARVLDTIDAELGLRPGAEVTTEANPDSVTAEDLRRLRASGYNRISLGMQSAVPHVLAALERSHTPGRPQQAAVEAREAGFEQVSLDLIYGAPGESDDDWQASLDAALEAEPTHVSAYSLIVEEGTRLARQVARGEVAVAEEDVLADRYLMADEALGGLGWYEVSNWGRPCRHNLGYWQSGDWWGAGPGAHSHVGGVRWWNAKHPTAWAARLAAGTSPAYAREVLSPEDRRVERVLLELRLRSGLPRQLLREQGGVAADRFVLEGQLAEHGDRLVLTARGRLLADALVRDLVD